MTEGNLANRRPWLVGLLVAAALALVGVLAYLITMNVTTLFITAAVAAVGFIVTVLLRRRGA
ncbi:hypothetical protein PYV02_05770 [Leifsonia sp. H3M29-4]|jgi:predicted outer membrane lipoprotein|uniref:hypothetical protein n=1 Tax=Salinibacterium metalliresistens TaxID=3031321 RepID=UPI0023D99BE2|nr:hypothetical protein [Salinibacterium metalliresistens]MDF1478589.1 hypothetical protein [Salinibacterium metalliresistens]